jgi:hypothetical protein
MSPEYLAIIFALSYTHSPIYFFEGMRAVLQYVNLVVSGDEEDIFAKHSRSAEI